MDKNLIEGFKADVKSIVDEALEAKLASFSGADVAAEVRATVEKMRLERGLFGRDITGLDEKTKKDFAEVVRASAFPGAVAIDTKANEALIEEQDNRGGYLVSRDVADAILRIAASVGTILSQARKWDLKTDELGIPNYTGSYLTGSYLGVDVSGTVQGLVFGQAMLLAKKWQLAFVVGNDLLADASVNLADWLLAIAGESLANMIDQQGLVGTGAPFVGVMNASGTTAYTLASTKTHYSDYAVVDDSSNMIGQLEESILDGACFMMHRTTWAALRAQKDTAGNYILPFAGLAAGNPVMEDVKGGGPVKPAGQILGYPVYTNRWMPVYSTSANAAKGFIIFGNFKATAFGDRGEMRVAQFESGSFGGKEVALADQKGIVYKHRHGFVVALPAAFVIATTAAS